MEQLEISLNRKLNSQLDLTLPTVVQAGVLSVNDPDTRGDK